LDDLRAVSDAVGAPVLVGSGLTAQNAQLLAAVATGAVVGTSIKVGERVDLDRARAVQRAFRAAWPAARG
jgi:predicted TIM-barrel enzyme